MKTMSQCFRVRRVTTRELAMVLGVAVVFLAPVVASADLPPFEGSSDDVTYGDMPHSTLGVELQTREQALALGSDDVSYPQAAPADVREGTEVRAAFDEANDSAKSSGLAPQPASAQEQ
jgi:hypothetical protein